MKAYGKYFPVFLTLGLIYFNCVSASAGSLQDPQAEPSQVAAVQDPIARLNLTPEQRQRIRAIREENRDERAAITQRLRESNFALEQALDDDNPNEVEIEQRLRDLAAAQAASTRMRVLTELKIRRVLTREQISLWRSFRQEAAATRRSQAQPGRQTVDGARPTQRNGIAPFPRRNQPPRNPRP